ncbi:molybdopterin synthase sulfur carrier subunit [Brachybacterium vulturis]|uniref:Molybdopterin synthase sulfur carrier subunit n=1 Tax=Brachybacterium vulturis TaxID=2017484 RepID=A0A291GR75_9MICO|nr:MoaD/ThiS family protein [Brachybacterium vulturis]ATG52725.1 molybdopterin synthase sulfur carrier subunit [Brachybacterium vulturis]
MTDIDRRDLERTPEAARTTAGPGAPASPAAPHIAARLFAGAAAEYGADAVSLQASTLGEAIDALQAGASDSAARVIGRSSFLLNAVAGSGREQRLSEGDRLDVLPPFAGG